MTNRPHTTLFMLMSADGKISTGVGDDRDFDKDIPKLMHVVHGLQQYYDLEQKTDLYSWNTGKVMAKVGWNKPKSNTPKTPVSFIIVDNQPHLTKQGIQNLLDHTQKLIIVTTKSNHPAMNIDNHGLEVILCPDGINFIKLFQQLKRKGIERITVQSGGEMNATLLRSSLIDELSIVVAPMLVGGKTTPTLIDGKQLESPGDLKQIRSLQLISAQILNDSYLHLKYKVLN